MSRRTVLVAAVVAALVLVPGGAGAASSFTDAPGDAIGGAADIVQESVSNDEAGNVVFTITTNRTTFTSDDFVAIVLDVDKNPGTGLGGADFALVVDATGGTLLRWNGASFDQNTPQTTVRTSNNNMTVSVNRSELGGTKGFTFKTFSALDSNDAAEDLAPDSGDWAYDLVALAPQLDTLAARFSPARPRAGHVFRLTATTVRLEDGSIVKAEAITCRATLAGKRLAGRCSWRIPKNAHGKRLAVYLTVSYHGETATFTPWRFVVR